MSQQYSYLALGDSYTIGTSVLLKDSFPYQLVSILRRKGNNFNAPEIIAANGWTTDELAAAIKDYHFLSSYDFITLLIGVNNQYRGKSVEEYSLEFEKILKRVISLAKDKTERIIVLSIPDYSITPFAADKDPGKITSEIDLFNSVNRALSIQYKVQYADINADYRKNKNGDDFLSDDNLHPSVWEYGKWIQILVEIIVKELK